MSSEPTTNNKRLRQVMYHLLVWVLYVTFNYLVSYVSRRVWIYPADTIAKYFIAALIFYATVYVLHRFYAPGKYFLCAMLIIAICFVSFLPKEFIYIKIFPLLGIEDNPYTTVEFFIMHTWWWLQYTSFGSAFWFFGEVARKEKRLRLTEQKQLYAEREKLRSEQEKLLLENAHLRAQINPHFLFNTLSYFHNRAIKADPILAEGILVLSDIMRNAIEQPEGDGLVSLEEEIENIGHLISIYRMRFGNEVAIWFEEGNGYEGLKILPHILVTFVENALKHGELLDEARPLSITAAMRDGDFLFTVTNYKHTGPKDPSHGIGIRYIRSQLERAYKDNYLLRIEDNKNFYGISLCIAGSALATSTESLIKETI